MERGLAHAVYVSEVYDGDRVWRVVHHIALTVNGGWWGADKLCDDQAISGGEIRKTDWNAQPWVHGKMVTCLTCLVHAWRWSS